MYSRFRARARIAEPDMQGRRGAICCAITSRAEWQRLWRARIYEWWIEPGSVTKAI
jgi:hypothetical protein